MSELIEVTPKAKAYLEALRSPGQPDAVRIFVQGFG